MQKEILNKNNTKKNLTLFEEKTVDFFTNLIIDYILKQEREQKERNNERKTKS